VTEHRPGLRTQGSALTQSDINLFIIEAFLKYLRTWLRCALFTLRAAHGCGPCQPIRLSTSQVIHAQITHSESVLGDLKDFCAADWCRLGVLVQRDQ